MLRTTLFRAELILVLIEDFLTITHDARTHMVNKQSDLELLLESAKQTKCLQKDKSIVLPAELSHCAVFAVLCLQRCFSTIRLEDTVWDACSKLCRAATRNKLDL